MKPESPVSRRSAFLVSAIGALALASCGAGGGDDGVILAIDEAFVASRPVLCAILSKDPRLGGGDAYRPLSLAEGPTRALDAAAKERESRGKVSILMASPLVASALIGGGSWSGDPALVVAEWLGSAKENFSSARSDPLPAYASAGAVCGAYIAALEADGGSPAGGILFTASASRPEAAMAAFIAAFAQSGASSAPIARELEYSNDVPSADAAAEGAVAEILGSDIKVLFLALGSATPAAIRAAARPGIALGADYPSSDSPPALAFRISPDEKALAAALRSLTATARKGGATAQVSVPCALHEMPDAAAYFAGGRSLEAIIRETRRKQARIKGRRVRVGFPAPVSLSVE